MGVQGLVSNTEYQATDITGKMVLQGTIFKTDPKIDVPGLKPGIYIYSVFMSKVQFTG